MGDSEEKNSITNNSFFPEEGDIFIFPAWLKHWVYPYRSDAIRVSVSGNIVDSLGLDFMSPDGIQAAIKDIEKQNPKKNKK
jgi:gentisate 1,2-dioxygenase